MNPIHKEIIKRFRDIHRCHTIILYGSRARGDFNSASDWDVIGFRHEGPAIRDTEFESSEFILDGFLYADSDVHRKEKEFLRVIDGHILFEEKDFGTNLLKELQKIYSQGPDPYPESEIKAGKDWTRKMLLRMKREDLEGNYRRHWLLFALLEDYFRYRNLFFMGAKQGLKYLKENDVVTYQLYEKAVHPQATIEDIENLATKIIE